mgnify:CR=1 FL=1
MMEYDAETDEMLNGQYFLIKHYSGKYEVKVSLVTMGALAPKIITRGDMSLKNFGFHFDVDCPNVSGLSGFISEVNLMESLLKAFQKLEEMARRGANEERERKRAELEMVEDLHKGNDVN